MGLLQSFQYYNNNKGVVNLQTRVCFAFLRYLIMNVVAFNVVIRLREISSHSRL